MLNISTIALHLTSLKPGHWVRVRVHGGNKSVTSSHFLSVKPAHASPPAVKKNAIRTQSFFSLSTSNGGLRNRRGTYVETNLSPIRIASPHQIANS
jgi:hypothetical protein